MLRQREKTIQRKAANSEPITRDANIKELYEEKVHHWEN
jgi:hypothetical protein